MPVLVSTDDDHGVIAGGGSLDFDDLNINRVGRCLFFPSQRVYSRLCSDPMSEEIPCRLSDLSARRAPIERLSMVG